jgi:hypothetical protein
MKIWASVYPKNVNEQSDVTVLGDDWCRDLECLIVRDATILFLYRFSLYGGQVRAVDVKRSFSVI